VGKQADLVIVDAPDYRHLAYQFGINLVKRVIKRGGIIDNESNRTQRRALDSGGRCQRGL
jgi:imidazolonepropionase-like amidohydrolase